MRTMPNRIHPAAATLLAVALSLALVAPLAAQSGRYALRAGDVAIYNLAGQVELVPASGQQVRVEAQLHGADAERLEVAVGDVRGRQALRVIYPSDDIVYPRLGRGTRVAMRVRRDGTFGGDGPRGEQVTIQGRGRGLEAYADLRVEVPEGQRLTVMLGAGEVDVENVDGRLMIDTGSGSVEVTDSRGSLGVDTGSGSVRVDGFAGDALEIDTGSGSVRIADARARRFMVDTGSGSVTVEGARADVLIVDTGSGGVRLSGITADDVRVDTGSGSVRLGLENAPRAVEVDTGSGSVTVHAAADLNAEIEIDTGSGGIDVEVPVSVIERERSYFRGRAGEGRGRIHIDTGSGSVRVVRG